MSERAQMMQKYEDFLVVGETYFTRNPGADNYVGRLVEIIDPFTVRLEDAAWVAESGRLCEFCRNGKTAQMEIEPVGDCITRYQAIIKWPHTLFKEAI